MKSKCKAVILDLDNLLWDEVPVKKAIFLDLYKKMVSSGKVRSLREAEILVREYQKKLLDENGYYSWNEVFLDLGGIGYGELLKQNKGLITPFPGVLETLEYLKQSYRLALVTDGAKDYTSFKVDTLGIRKYFPVIITTDETRTMKPNPTGWIMATKQLDIEVGDCIGAGDSIKDAESLHRANIEAIIINSDAKVREELEKFLLRVVFLEKFSELKNIL